VRILALDIGEKRVGVAVSDPTQSVASPIAVLDAARLIGDGADLHRVLEDYEDVESMVIGVPRSLDGTEGPQARRVREAAALIAERFGLPIEFVDERLTSVEAERRMAEAGADSRARRGAVDMVAASIMLQAHLDARKGRA